MTKITKSSLTNFSPEISELVHGKKSNSFKTSPLPTTNSTTKLSSKTITSALVLIVLGFITISFLPEFLIRQNHFLSQLIQTPTNRPTQQTPAVATPTPTPETANWLTYQSDFFTIKYPPSFSLSDSLQNPNFVVFNGPQSTKGISKIEIQVTPNASLPQSSRPVNNFNPRIDYQQPTILIPNIPDKPQVQYYALNNNKLFQITLFGNISVNRPLAEQILSNFKFTEELPLQPVTIDPVGKIMGHPYPDELKYLGNLQELRCSNLFNLNTIDDSYSSLGPQQNTKQTLENQQILNFIDNYSLAANDIPISSIIYCQADNNTLVVYTKNSDGAGSSDRVYAGYLDSENTVNAVSVPKNYAEPFFVCRQVIALTRDNFLYLSCGAGDAGYGSASIIKLSLTSGEHTRLIHCTSRVDLQSNIRDYAGIVTCN